jgi:hypothetical protein
VLFLLFSVQTTSSEPSLANPTAIDQSVEKKHEQKDTAQSQLPAVRAVNKDGNDPVSLCDVVLYRAFKVSSGGLQHKF